MKLLAKYVQYRCKISILLRAVPHKCSKLALTQQSIETIVQPKLILVMNKGAWEFWAKILIVYGWATIFPNWILQH